MRRTLKGKDFTFRFRLTDIRDLDAEDLLASRHLADNIISILARQKNRAATIREVLLRISKQKGAARSVAFQQLLILAGLRKMSDEILEETKHMPFFNDLMDHELIGPAIRKGMEQGLEKGIQKGMQKGLQKGKQEGARTLLLHLIEKRFGKLTPAMEKKLATLAPSEVDALAIRVLDAKSMKSLFRSN